jgi:hypothetical protein
MAVLETSPRRLVVAPYCVVLTLFSSHRVQGGQPGERPVSWVCHPMPQGFCCSLCPCQGLPWGSRGLPPVKLTCSRPPQTARVSGRKWRVHAQGCGSVVPREWLTGRVSVYSRLAGGLNLGNRVLRARGRFDRRGLVAGRSYFSIGSWLHPCCAGSRGS